MQRVTGKVIRFDRQTKTGVEITFSGVVEQVVPHPTLPKKLTYVRVTRSSNPQVAGQSIIHLEGEDEPLTHIS